VILGMWPFTNIHLKIACWERSGNRIISMGQKRRENPKYIGIKETTLANRGKSPSNGRNYPPRVSITLYAYIV